MKKYFLIQCIEGANTHRVQKPLRGEFAPATAGSGQNGEKPEGKFQSAIQLAVQSLATDSEAARGCRDIRERLLSGSPIGLLTRTAMVELESFCTNNGPTDNIGLVSAFMPG